VSENTVTDLYKDIIDDVFK